MAISLSYDPVLSRIRVTATDPAPVDSDYMTFERSLDQVNWTFLRGGTEVTVDAVTGVATVDDYEFPPGVQVWYRVRGYAEPSDTIVYVPPDEPITQDLTQVWVKVVAKPFLNRPVIVADVGPVVRQSRNGVFPVVGRSFPVVVGDVRGSRQFTLQILTETPAQARDFDLLLASGDPVFLHVPSTSRVPTGYYFAVGDTEEAPTGRISQRRLFTLPLTEVAAPGPDIIGASINWQGVVNAFATWEDLITAEATWAEVLELIGSPTDVIIP